jgi:hypothetical protein
MYGDNFYSRHTSLQFLCNFVVINASERSLCFHIFRNKRVIEYNYIQKF